MSFSLPRIFFLSSFALTPWLPAAEPAASALLLTELSRKVIQTSDGTITYIRVRPPVLPPAPPLPAPHEPTAADRAEAHAADLAAAARDYVYLHVSATVYLDGERVLSQVLVRDESGRERFTAWSNVDFRHLAQIHHLESATTTYAWFPFVDTVDLATWPKDEPRPALPAVKLDPAAPDYVIALAPGQFAPTEDDETLAGLDYLHATYALDGERLRANFAALEAAHATAEAAEEARRKAPPVPRDTVIHFWPIRSGLNR